MKRSHIFQDTNALSVTKMFLQFGEPSGYLCIKIVFEIFLNGLRFLFRLKLKDIVIIILLKTLYKWLRWISCTNLSKCLNAKVIFSLLIDTQKYSISQTPLIPHIPREFIIKILYNIIIISFSYIIIMSWFKDPWLNNWIHISMYFIVAF